MFNVEHLKAIRGAEIDTVAARLKPGARVLELGAGTGSQSLDLARRGFDVVAIDLPTSNYADAREFPVIDYDGRTIPFPDRSFDVVFSSNVLEHVRDLDALHAETQRVLKPGGVCIHVLPTDTWRFWTTISAFPAAPQDLWQLAPDLLPRRFARGELIRLARTGLRAIALATRPIRQRRHGERGNILTELYYFRPEWWRRNFRAHGFEIVDDAPIGLFYTGNMVLPSLSFERRRQLARTLGSACHLFELRPVQEATTPIIRTQAEVTVRSPRARPPRTGHPRWLGSWRKAAPR